MSVDQAIYDFAIDPTNKRSSYYWQLCFLGTVPSVLEIGCATGFFSRYLVERGCRVVGVEVNPKAAQHARAVCSCVIVGDIETAATQAQVTERFEAVLLGDVLEHLRAPETLLTHIHQTWLAPHGRVVLSIPNAGHWSFRREVLYGRFTYRKYGLFDRTHLRFYTRASLSTLLTECGYQVERWAFTVNANNGEDLTFSVLAPLYRRQLFRAHLVQFEEWLAWLFPALFAYQFVCCLSPIASV